MLLKDGTETEDPRLDRLYELDWRSLDYPLSSALELSRPYSTYYPRGYTWAIDQTLDQGRDGACVGFAYAHDLIARPQVLEDVDGDPVDNLFAKERLYWDFQRVDQWAGGAYPGASPVYEGTSVLAGAKVMKREGFYDSYYWGLSLEHMAIGVGYDGPCIFGTNWHEGMFQPNENGFIVPTGAVMGGHAVLIYSVSIEWKTWVDIETSRNWENVDLRESYFKVKNSWGENWGEQGTCKISFLAVDMLLNNRGDACFPQRVPIGEFR